MEAIRAHYERLNAQSAQILTPEGVATLTVGELHGFATTAGAAAFYLENPGASPEGTANVIGFLLEMEAFFEEITGRAG
jgi:hypothetical protein